MKKEYVATFQTSNQLTQYDFEVSSPSMRVTTETTIAEIETFFRKYNKVGFMEVKIIELQ